MAFTIINSVKNIKPKPKPPLLTFSFSSYSSKQTISGYDVYRLNGGANITNSNYTIDVTGGSIIGDTPLTTKRVLIFIVGGGGGSETASSTVGAKAAGGGGGGRVIDTSFNIGHNQTINISVAGMSVPGSYGNDTSLNYYNTASVQQTIIAGGGGYGRINLPGMRPLNSNGGSGAGGGSTQYSWFVNGGQGYWGGNGGQGFQSNNGAPISGGGGGAGDGRAIGSGNDTELGGAGRHGGNEFNSYTNNGYGGIGRRPLNTTIFGSNYYAGGGGGGSRQTVLGGNGGGANGGINSTNGGIDGSVNTGGGGGGCYAGNYNNGNTQAGSQGGSGIVIVAIPI
jgi:hypothetical protein